MIFLVRIMIDTDCPQLRSSLWGEFDNQDVVVSANVDEVGDVIMMIIIVLIIISIIMLIINVFCDDQTFHFCGLTGPSLSSSA